MSEQTAFLQENQPDGVPPLKLTGERTLPDVPAENYWYRRHLVVYEWVARQLAGKRVIDLACGEGYGSAVLAQSAASVVGVDANPEAYEHARLRYTQPNLSFARELIEEFEHEADAVVFLQTIEHVQDPDAILERCKANVAGSDDPVVFVTTPNLLTLAPEGAEKSENPWHVKEYRAHEFAALCQAHFASVEIYGLYHARKLALHEFAIDNLFWDRIHKGLRISKPFYDRFTPAIAASDFTLSRERDLDQALDFLAVCWP